MTCVVCGDRLQRDRGARGHRCGTCTRYRQRHGTDRPDQLIIRLTMRDVERELRARLTHHLVV